MWSNGFQIAGGGTSFPSDPTVNDIYFRTDVRSLYVFTSAGTWSPISGCPIGTILAWHKTVTGMPGLPPGWVECSGGTVPDPESPIYGEPIPDLNGGEFLRGSTTSGTTRSDNVRQHSHVMTHGHSDTFTLPNHTHDVPGKDSGSGGNYQADGASSSGGLGWLSVATSNPNSLPSISGSVSNFSGNTGNYPTSLGSPNETYPRHMDVVWIMRIK